MSHRIPFIRKPYRIEQQEELGRNGRMRERPYNCAAGRWIRLRVHAGFYSVWDSVKTLMRLPWM